MPALFGCLGREHSTVAEARPSRCPQGRRAPFCARSDRGGCTPGEQPVRPAGRRRGGRPRRRWAPPGAGRCRSHTTMPRVLVAGVARSLGAGGRGCWACCWPACWSPRAPARLVGGRPPAASHARPARHGGTTGPLPAGGPRRPRTRAWTRRSLTTSTPRSPPTTPRCAACWWSATATWSTSATGRALPPATATRCARSPRVSPRRWSGSPWARASSPALTRPWASCSPATCPRAPTRACGE